MTVLEIVGQVLTVIGAAIFVAAAIGLRRFGDPYARMSAVATAGGLGMAFVTVGALLTMPSVADGIKVALAVALQLATSAVGAMVIARAAIGSRHRFQPGTILGPLEEDAEMGEAGARADGVREHGAHEPDEPGSPRG